MVPGFVIVRLICSSLLRSVLGGAAGPCSNPSVVVGTAIFRLWWIWGHIDVDDLIGKPFLVEFVPIRPRLLPSCTLGDRLSFRSDCSG